MRLVSIQFDVVGLPDAERLLFSGGPLDMAYSPAVLLTASQLVEMKRREAAADAGAVQSEPWDIVRVRVHSVL